MCGLSGSLKFVRRCRFHDPSFSLRELFPTDPCDSVVLSTRAPKRGNSANCHFTEQKVCCGKKEDLRRLLRLYRLFCHWKKRAARRQCVSVVEQFLARSELTCVLGGESWKPDYFVKVPSEVRKPFFNQDCNVTLVKRHRR